MRADDLQELLEVYGDRDAMKWVDDGDVLSYEDALRWIQITANNYETRGYGMSAIIELQTGKLIGFCGLVHPNGQQEVEVKYAFKRHVWGQGFATETVKAMLDYAVHSLQISDVIATTAPENCASHKVLMNAGFSVGEVVIEEDGSKTQVFNWKSQAD